MSNTGKTIRILTTPKKPQRPQRVTPFELPAPKPVPVEIPTTVPTKVKIDA